MIQIIALALALAQGQGRWQQVGTTGTGNPVFIEARSVRKGADGMVHATVRVAYAKPVKVPGGELTASRAQAMFNCTARTFATKENALYFDEKSNRTFQRTVNKQPGFGPTIAGNFADVALKHFCDAPPGKKEDDHRVHEGGGPAGPPPSCVWLLLRDRLHRRVLNA